MQMCYNELTDAYVIDGIMRYEPRRRCSRDEILSLLFAMAIQHLSTNCRI